MIALASIFLIDPNISRVLLLQDHNTRVVVCGVTLLGMASGVVGTFTLLRRRALVGDALSHATLPGICIAFLIAVAAGRDGRSLPLLLAGGTASGLLGVASLLFIRRYSLLREDAALAIVLSVLFGFGLALLGIVQQTSRGHAAGLQAFIFGRTASMLERDAWIIGGVSLGCVLMIGVAFKELVILCFDERFAKVDGLPVRIADLLLLGCVTAVTLAGLQAVGMVLVIALLVTPAAAARFWTDRAGRMLCLAGALGGGGGMFGAMLSALLPRFPSGPIIILTGTAIFIGSLLFGRAQGLFFKRKAHTSSPISRS